MDETAQGKTARRLYTAAEQADARLSATIAARTNGKRDRWTLTAEDKRNPEIREALREKLNADEVWLTFLRTSRDAANSAIQAAWLEENERW